MGLLSKQLMLLAAALLSAILAHGQSGSSDSAWLPESPFMRYTTIDGLSQSDISDITQDETGHLWLATARGVNRFDGSTFAHYTIADGLARNDVTALVASRNGEVWIGDSRGNLAMIRNGLVVRTIDAGAALGHRITELLDFDGQLFVATENGGLFSVSINETEPELILRHPSTTLTHDLVIREGSLWFVQDDALQRMTVGKEDAVAIIVPQVLAGTVSGDGSYWLISADRKIGVWNGDVLDVRYQLPLVDQVRQFAAGSDDKVWVSTDQGLYEFREPVTDGDASAYKFFGKDMVSSVGEIFVDREETLWHAGADNSSGLSRYLGDRFKHYKIPYQRGSATVWAISEDSKGQRYIATSDKLLRLSPEGNVTDLSEVLGLPEVSVRDLMVTEGDILWVGTGGSGLLRVDLARAQSEVIPGTEGLAILDLDVDSFGLMWASTSGKGIYSIDTRDISQLRSYAAVDEGIIYTLTVDADDNVWYGLDYKGLGKLNRLGRNDVEQEFYGEEAGLGSIGYGQITVSATGQIWIGGENGMLLQFDSGELRDFSRDSPLLDQTIYIVFELADGALLLGGEKGIFYFDPITSESRRYGPLHGFLGMETNVHASFLDSEGYLWLGTIDGPTRMDINQSLPIRADITPQILSVKTQKTQTRLLSGDELASHEGGLQLVFETVSLREHRSLEYSFRLAGRDEDWSLSSQTRSVSYSGLAPGQYRFEVRARYPDSQWYVNANAFEFNVLAPFWRKPWFIAILLIACTLLLYKGVRLRTGNVDRLNLRLRAEVEERTRSIERGRIELLESNRRLRQEVEERHLADVARAEVEARFRVAFQTTPIGMALIDIDGELLNSNRALRTMFLAPKDHDNDETKTNAISFIDEDDREALWADFQRVLKGEIDTIESEYICRRFDGEALHTKLSLTSVRDEDDKYMYCIAQVQDITESRELTDALEYQANYDELSGLLNRRSFEKALDRAYVQSEKGEVHSYLMFMDLDQFKIVNDTSGHSAGDELLRQISGIIREEVRVDDIVGRLGGDEFGLILWQCPTSVAHRIAEAIRTAIEEYQFQWDAETYRIGISVGAVAIDSALGTTAEIQQLADAACYQAKDNGRNRVHFAQEEGESINEQRGEARWVQRLHEAMDNNRFALYGQLIKPIRAQGREPDRMEILLRMREPRTRRLIPPGAFLPAAERYGLSVRLDEWVVRSLLKMLYVHDAVGASDRRYWINLSGNSVGDRRFVDFLIAEVKNCGLPGGMINFEITETAVIRNVGEAGRLMSQLGDIGCQFALDDFGSGLSSFGYLKKLPVDYIKIDGMFIRDILTDEIDRIFVKSIIDIARTMGIKTIAEFVENTAILAVVSELGADYVQGFGVHRPELIAPEFPAKPMILDRRGTPLEPISRPIKEKLA